MIRGILLASAGAIALTSAALAAEPLAVPPPPPYVPLPWTGFYVGLNAGYEWSNSVTVGSTGYPIVSDPTGAYEAALVGVGTATLPVKTDGFLGGGQVGYNFEFPNHTVASLEGDIQGVAGASSSVTGGSFIPVPAFGDSYTTALAASHRLDFFGTLRGRYGYLFTPTLLVYGTGGLAFGGISTKSGFVANETLFGYPSVFGSSSLSTTDVGWSVGGGLEWMFMPHLSLKVEYLYYSLTKETSSFGYLTQNVAGAAFASALTHFTIRPQGSVVRVGINYLFTFDQPPPIIAKY
ncbi:MAG TPA: outer membrane beta-barrel protein [Methylocella sp.]|nr:outer membrane beta-barrel protein [Methylocella sp.]